MWLSGRPEDLVWCLHCERVSHRSEWGERWLRCPYEGCDGHAGDDWSWLQIVHANSEYDVNPVRGVVYPLYPTAAERRRVKSETRTAKLRVD